MIRLHAPGRRTIAAIGASLCFLISSFLCGFSGCDSHPPRSCHPLLSAPATYQIIYKSDSTGAFTAMTFTGAGGGLFGEQTIADCNNVESIRVLHGEAFGQIAPAQQSSGRETLAGR